MCCSRRILQKWLNCKKRYENRHFLNAAPAHTLFTRSESLTPEYFHLLIHSWQGCVFKPALWVLFSSIVAVPLHPLTWKKRNFLNGAAMQTLFAQLESLKALVLKVVYFTVGQDHFEQVCVRVFKSWRSTRTIVGRCPTMTRNVLKTRCPKRVRTFRTPGTGCCYLLISWQVSGRPLVDRICIWKNLSRQHLDRKYSIYSCCQARSKPRWTAPTHGCFERISEQTACSTAAGPSQGRFCQNSSKHFGPQVARQCQGRLMLNRAHLACMA